MAGNRLFAARIKIHRRRQGLSPEQYGIRIGVSGRTVRRVEEGYTPFDWTQKRFAADMGLEVDELFPETRRRRRQKVAA